MSSRSLLTVSVLWMALRPDWNSSCFSPELGPDCCCKMKVNLATGRYVLGIKVWCFCAMAGFWKQSGHDHMQSDDFLKESTAVIKNAINTAQLEWIHGSCHTLIHLYKDNHSFGECFICGPWIASVDLQIFHIRNLLIKEGFQLLNNQSCTAGPNRAPCDL